MLTEEGKLKERVKAHLKKIGAHYFMPVQRGFGRQSVDFLCCINGRYTALETKSKGKKPTPRQDQYMQEVLDAGGAAFWCDDFESYLLNMAAWGLI